MKIYGNLACVIETDSSNPSPARRDLEIPFLPVATHDDTTPTHSSDGQNTNMGVNQELCSGNFHDNSLKAIQRKTLSSLGGSVSNKKKSTNSQVTFDIPRMERKMTTS